MTAAERGRLEREIRALRAANEELRAECGRAASQHAQVAGLLAACHRLHATLERQGVLAALEEMLVTLVGWQEAGVYDLEGEPPRLTLVAAFGIAAEALPPLPDGVLPAMTAGRLFIAAPYGLEIAPRPSACLPLRVDGRVTGALALFRLFDHKPGLTNADWALLDVISTHAATALVATRPRRSGSGSR